VSSDSEAGPGDQFKDIFLDFLNRDSRQIHEVFRLLGRDYHLQLLSELLNVAAFICRDRCIMPPGFAAEDEYVRAVMRTAEALTEHRLIRWPIRESLDDYWDKKEREYAPLRGEYSGLFDKGAQKFVEANAHLLMDRSTSIGRELVKRWEAAPDDDKFWRQRSAFTAPTVVELFRAIPRRLAEDGIAITWSAIHSRVSELARQHPEYRELVQHIYFGLYIDEFDLRVISNAPLARLSFGLGTDELFYDYQVLEALLAPTELWGRLLRMSPWDLVRLRQQPAYFEFRRLAYAICANSRSKYELRENAAVASSDAEPILKRTAVLDAVSVGQQLSIDVGEHDDEWVEAFADRIAAVAGLAHERMQNEEASRQSGLAAISRIRAALRHRKGGRVNLAVFAALKEERDVLIHRWGLTGVPNIGGVWQGKLGNADVLLYGGLQLGRVPAAVATARLLMLGEKPDLIVVAGLAGGFAEAGVATGAVLVPFTIADLASRKVDGDSTRIRPDPYEVDRRLGGFLDNQFDVDKWTAFAAREGGWPDNLRPHLKLGGTLACLDEVVSDAEYRGKLLAAWDKLQGVEMEAGGVFAAARALEGPPVAVVRAVSDMADSAKADNEWRRRGIITIAAMLEQVDWAALMTMVV
jgi:nucleoside phosphorylase